MARFLRRELTLAAGVVVLICLAGAATAAAQAGTGTLTGRVLDGQGAAVPGALVTVTEVATGAVRTATSDGDGAFRFPALPAGRYTVDVTLSGFAPLKMTDVPLAPAEVRSLEAQLKVGQLAETVTVTAESATVQTATSSRMGTVTAEQLTNIQMKGRDIWGLMAVVPGVQDTNMDRNFTTWTSMSAITINGMPNTSKVVVMDGVNIIDELGTNAMVNPNIDAVGEVQIISNGFTAENGRASGGMIIMTTKSGTNRFSGSGWYNARRTGWTANQYFRKKQNLAKPLYHVNIPGYSLGGPVIIPKVVSRGKAFFFVSQEYTDDLRPTTPSRVNYPTALERQGDFSQTYFGTADGPGQGTLQPIIDPETGQAFPGNRIPANRINALGQRMLNLLPMPNDIHNPQPGQYNAANSSYETLPLHSRTNSTLRFDVVLSSRIRGSYRFINDREDNISNNVFAPGIGYANNAVPGYISTGNITMVLSKSMVNEVTTGFAHNSYSWIPGTGEHFEDYRQYYRSAAGVDPPRLEPFGSYADPQQWGYSQSDEYPYLPTMSYSGGSRAGLANYNPAAAAARILPAANRNDRWTFQNDLSWTLGRHNLKFGVSTEWASKTEPLSPDYRGNYNFGHDAQNPLSTGNGYANALPWRVHDLYGADRPRRSRSAALVHGRVRAGQLAREAELHPRLRRAHDAHRRLLRHASIDGRLLRAELGSEAGATALPAGLHDRRAGQRDVRGGEPARGGSGQSGRAPAERVRRQSRAGVRYADQRHARRRVSRAAPRRVLQVPVVRRRAAHRVRVGHQGGRQAGAARISGDFLRRTDARVQRRRVGTVRRAAARGLQPSGALGQVQRHRELRGVGKELRREPDQRGVCRRRNAIARAVVQPERDLST